MATSNDIVKKVRELIRKHGTRNPWELAKCLGIIVSIEPMEAEVKGIFTSPLRIKQIILSSNLDEISLRIVLAHEIGHAVLHANCGIGFIREYTLFPTGKFEVQANKFAAELLLGDDTMEIIKEYGIHRTAHSLGVPVELVEYKWLKQSF